MSEEHLSKAYRATVVVEAEYMLNTLRDVAHDERYDQDLFVNHVLDEIRRLMEDEHST